MKVILPLYVHNKTFIEFRKKNLRTIKNKMQKAYEDYSKLLGYTTSDIHNIHHVYQSGQKTMKRINLQLDKSSKSLSEVGKYLNITVYYTILNKFSNIDFLHYEINEFHSRYEKL